MSERYCKDCRYCHHANIGLLCMGQKGMPHTSPYGSCNSWKSAKQTNAERIRAMTDEELAEWLCDIAGWIPMYEGKMHPILDWLKQEARDGKD